MRGTRNNKQKTYPNIRLLFNFTLVPLVPLVPHYSFLNNLLYVALLILLYILIDKRIRETGYKRGTVRNKSTGKSLK